MYFKFVTFQHIYSTKKLAEDSTEKEWWFRNRFRQSKDKLSTICKTRHQEVGFIMLGVDVRRNTDPGTKIASYSKYFGGALDPKRNDLLQSEV